MSTRTAGSRRLIRSGHWGIGERGLERELVRCRVRRRRHDGPQAPTSLPALLRATATQSWASIDNTGGRLLGDTLDDFASWAADVLGAPVAVYEVDVALTGMWPANPNLVATWYTSFINLQNALRGYRDVAVEDASVPWALSKSRV